MAPTSLSLGLSLSSSTSLSPSSSSSTTSSATTIDAASLSSPSSGFAAARKIRNMKNLSLVVAPTRGTISAPASPALNGPAVSADSSAGSSLQPLTSIRDQRRTSTPGSFYYHSSKVNASSPTLGSVPSTPLSSIPIFTRRENNAGNDLPTADPYKFEPVCILPMLYLGTEHNAANREVMSRLRVEYILNVAKEVQNPHEESDFYPDREEGEPMETEAEASSPTLSISSSASSSSSLSSFRSNMSSSSSYERQNSADQDHTMDVTSPPRDDDDDDLDDPTKFVFNVLPPSNRNSLTVPLNLDDVPSTPGPASLSFPEVPSTPISSYMPMSPLAASAPSLLINPTSPTFPDHPPTPFERVHYKKFPWVHNQENLMADFARAFAFIDEARDAGRSVLVHCQCGVSRSASLVIAYVMRARRMTLDQAYAFVKERSPWISPNMGLVYQLKDFEKAIGVGEWGRRASVSGFGARLAVRQARRERNENESEAVAELKREVLKHAEGQQQLLEQGGRKRSLGMRSSSSEGLSAAGGLMPVEENEGEDVANGDAKKRGNGRKKDGVLGMLTSLGSKNTTRNMDRDIDMDDAMQPPPTPGLPKAFSLSLSPLLLSPVPQSPVAPLMLSPSSSLTTSSTAPSTPLVANFFGSSAPSTPTSTTSSRKRHQRRPLSTAPPSPRLSNASSTSLASAITSVGSSPARTPIFAPAAFLAGKAATVATTPTAGHDGIDTAMEHHDGFTAYTENAVFSPTRLTPPVTMTSFSEVLSSLLGSAVAGATASASVATGVAAATSVAVSVSTAMTRDARALDL